MKTARNLPIDLSKCPSYKVAFSGCNIYGAQRLTLACIMRDILNEMNIPWFIENGTLLGAYRNNKFIPHDDDFDIAMLYNKNPLEQIKQNLLFIKNRLPKHYDARWVDTYTHKIEVFEPRMGNYILKGPQYKKANYHHVTIDLQAYQLNGDAYDRLYAYLPLKIYKTDIFPIGKIVLENEQFPAPGDIKAILTDNYGSLSENAVYNPETKKYECKTGEM